MCTRVYICTVHNVRRRAKNTLLSRLFLVISDDKLNENECDMAVVRAFGSPIRYKSIHKIS